LRDGARETRQGMRGLRSLLVDIYPPNLHAAGLEPALRDLLEPLAARGIDAELECAAPADLPRDTEQAVFRTAQEALRNVVKHAGARRARVQLSAPNGVVRLVVEDDGRGFDSEAVRHRQEQGHLGIAFLADRAADLGGSLDIDSQPGRGTRVVLEVPR
jgi:signal transduction histidine kinase